MKKSVIVVTNDSKVVSLIGSILIVQNYELFFTQSKLNIIYDILYGDEISLIILDFDPSSDDNLEFLRIIVKIRPRIPVIVLSEDNSVESLKKIKAHHVSYVGIKPINKLEIEQVISALVNSKPIGMN